MDLQQLRRSFSSTLSELKDALRLLKKIYSNLDMDDQLWVRDQWFEFFDAETSVHQQLMAVRKLCAAKSLRALKDVVIAIKTEIDVYRHGCPDLSGSGSLSGSDSDSESDDAESDDPGSPTKRIKLAEDDDRSTKRGDRLERQPRTTRKVRIVVRPKTNKNDRPLLCKGVDEPNQTPRILPDDPSTRSNSQAFSSNTQAFSSNAQAFSSNAQALSSNAQALSNSDQEFQGSRPRGMVARIIEKYQKKECMDQTMKDT